jgi:hypothetical protein
MISLSCIENICDLAPIGDSNCELQERWSPFSRWDSFLWRTISPWWVSDPPPQTPQGAASNNATPKWRPTSSHTVPSRCSFLTLERDPFWRYGCSLMFRRNVLTPSSGSKSKPNKQPVRNKQSPTLENGDYTFFRIVRELVPDCMASP